MSGSPTRLTAEQAYDLAVRIGLAWRELRRGASASDLRQFLYGLDDGAIEMGQMDTLDLLASQPSWRMSELADALRVDPSTATRAVQRLLKDGLAQRRQSTVDGRVVKVEITERGRTVHETVAARRAELMTHILRTYRADELHVLADLLERFVNAVDDFVAVRSPS